MAQKFPSDLPQTLFLRLKDKGRIDLAEKLAAIKLRKGLNTYAETLEIMIEEFDNRDKLCYQLKRNCEAANEKAERFQNRINNFRAALAEINRPL